MDTNIPNGSDYAHPCTKCALKSCCEEYLTPLMLPTDLKKLASRKKKSEQYLDSYVIKGKTLPILKNKEGTEHCVFWDKETGMCQIYEDRPIDCRLFPYDIYEINKEYYWILYSCSQDRDANEQWKELHEKYIAELERDSQFPELMQNITYFSDDARMVEYGKSGNKAYENYIVLRRVKHQ